MSSERVDQTRVVRLAESNNAAGRCVLYVMSRDQRIKDNHALLAAQAGAVQLGLPLVVCFVVNQRSQKRSYEHVMFMIDGLKQVEEDLKALNIGFVKRLGRHQDVLPRLTRDIKPSAIYFDMSPLRGPRAWQQHIAEAASCDVFLVDTHNIVPVWEAAEKQEYAAHTIRRKIHRKLHDYLQAPAELKAMQNTLEVKSDSWSDIEKSIDVRKSGINIAFESGEAAALGCVEDFASNKLSAYAQLRNNPVEDVLSGFSPYLHFGQISSLRIIIRLLETTGISRDRLWQLNQDTMPKNENLSSAELAGLNTLIEEMVVRKELADNYCYYNPDYDSLDGAADWAQRTLQEHAGDQREHIYTYDELEAAKTHDAVWNASQMQMRTSGKMHGYMRMYWAKKILEWTRTPQEALEFAIKLNDFYSIDGGDPNGYTGIMWSIAGVHDRAWTERPIFGKIRYMNYGGLKRKFNVEGYTDRWADDLSEQ